LLLTAAQLTFETLDYIFDRHFETFILVGGKQRSAGQIHPGFHIEIFGYIILLFPEYYITAHDPIIPLGKVAEFAAYQAFYFFTSFGTTGFDVYFHIPFISGLSIFSTAKLAVFRYAARLSDPGIGMENQLAVNSRRCLLKKNPFNDRTNISLAVLPRE
jgi:hypothetical protein